MEDSEVTRLQDELNKVRRQLEQVLIEQITIEDIAIENGMITATFATHLTNVFADAFADLLVANDARNYVETTFKTNDGELIVVTIQKHNGKTPHQLRIDAEGNSTLSS